ncbi:MAG: NF038143 family protein [Deltaproteobacteria bacterium]|nr:NF038143 family protein [Deltaproteobacteria bacterium]
MGEKNIIILSAEASFARRVALGALVRRPVKPLLQMIPGMFIFDFLKRNHEIKRYSKFYMPPRRLALEAALAILYEDDRGAVHSKIEHQARAWLESLTLHSDDANDALAAMITLMADHYLKLLGAEGDEYIDLVKGAYKGRDAYESFVEELLSLEGRFIRTISDGLEASDIFRQRLLEEQSQVEEQRIKETEAIFVA